MLHDGTGGLIAGGLLFVALGARAGARRPEEARITPALMPGSPSCRYLLREVAAGDAQPLEGTGPVDDCSSRFDARLGRDGNDHGEGAGHRAFAIRESTGDRHAAASAAASRRPARTAAPRLSGTQPLGLSPRDRTDGAVWVSGIRPGRDGTSISIRGRRRIATRGPWLEVTGHVPRRTARVGDSGRQSLALQASDLRRAAPAADRVALDVQAGQQSPPALVFQRSDSRRRRRAQGYGGAAAVLARDPSRDAVGTHSGLVRVTAPARRSADPAVHGALRSRHPLDHPVVRRATGAAVSGENRAAARDSGGERARGRAVWVLRFTTAR